MSGCFEDIREAERPVFSCDRHAFGGADTLYEAFVCSEMGSVCEMMPYAHIDPATCLVADVLRILRYRLDSGSLPSTLKVYVAAIASFRSPMDGQSINRHALVVIFLKGARRLQIPRTRLQYRPGPLEWY